MSVITQSVAMARDPRNRTGWERMRSQIEKLSEED